MLRKMTAWLFAMLFVFSAMPASADVGADAVSSEWSIYVDGELTKLKGYNIGGTNYYKLRDIAMAVTGTQKQFDVSWTAETNEIHMTSKTPYTVLGGELSDLQNGASEKAVATKSPIYLDGNLTKYNSYYINGNNYFRLREILKGFDIGLGWKDEDKSVHINTALPYAEDDEAVSFEEAAEQVVIVRKLDEDRNTIAESLGFLISKDGKIATSFHAIRGAEIVTVSYPGKPEQEIQGVIAWNQEKNIAVIKSGLETDTPLSVKDGDIQAQDEIITFANTGRQSIEAVDGKVLSKENGKDAFVNFKLPENSIGSPIMDKNGKVAGMVYSGFYLGRHQMMMVPASEIYSLNLNAEPKTVLEFRRHLYMMAGDIEERMLSNMLYSAIDPMHFNMNIPYADKVVDIISLRASVTDEQAHKLFIRILIAENEYAGYSFRQHSQTQEGEERIFECLQEMLDVLFTYMPEYEVSGEIQCGMLEVLERDEEGKITQYEFYPNEEDEGGKVTFGYASEYNGWLFEIE